MIKNRMFVCLMAAAGPMLVTPAQAQAQAQAQTQVRDAEYRGTIVCENLPFAAGQNRAAIVVKLASNEGPYERTVHLSGSRKVAGTETGTAKVDGDKISMTGGWKGEKASYEASYDGSFVRRRAKLTGTQKWTHDGQSYTRNCSGSIQRPLAAFLPKSRKPAAAE
jgi:hypothetical protein